MAETDNVVEAGGEYRFHVHEPGAFWRPDEGPRITIQARGDLTINTSGYADMGNPEAVEMLYDPNRNAVGLRPADPNIPTAVRFRASQHRKNLHVLPGSAFVRRNNIDTSVGRRYPARMVDGILVADLQNGEPTTGGRRSGARA